MSRKSATALAEKMKREPRDFPLDEIYRLVCRPPHQELTPAQLHSRCSRAIGEARAALRKDGYVLAAGALRHSYRADMKRRG